MGYAVLTDLVGSQDTEISVNSTESFEDKGTLFIDDETASYEKSGTTRLLLVDRGILGTNKTTHLQQAPVYTVGGLLFRIAALERLQKNNASIRDVKNLSGPAYQKAIDATAAMVKAQRDLGDLKEAISGFQQALADSHVIPVFNEVPVGAIDGLNTSFKVTDPYKTGTMILVKNRFVLQPGLDYTESDPGKGEFVLSVAPGTTESLHALAYVKG